MSDQNPILEQAPLSFPWPTVDPFLFCAYHKDDYPEGGENLGPDPALLKGRNLGMDFTTKDGFRMYHGESVPGFPSHPHRGFETVTLVQKGYCDHSDSLGATARFGAGDAQWLTAGKGIVHSEMFPLLKKDEPNPIELFQIWLNLPKARKMAEPHYSILWSQDIPTLVEKNEDGREARVTVVAGQLGDARPPSPPPESWASDANNDVAVWVIDLEEGGSFELPPAHSDSTRALYFFEGESCGISGGTFSHHSVFALRPDCSVSLHAHSGRCKFLVLQGKPLDEPVVHHGPFVMNTSSEINDAIRDYQRTGFGGWPWKTQGPNLGPERGRFSQSPDGTIEEFPLNPVDG